MKINMHLNSRLKLVQENDSYNGRPTGAEGRELETFKGAPINCVVPLCSRCQKFGVTYPCQLNCAGAYVGRLYVYKCGTFDFVKNMLCCFNVSMSNINCFVISSL